ncbi:MAG: PAS domain-containing protein [Sphingobium sp.]
MPDRGTELRRLSMVGASGSWDWDIRGGVLRADAGFAALHGLNAQDMAVGVETACFFRAIHVDDRPRIRIAVAGMLAGAELFSKEFRILLPDGAVLWVHARGQTHLDEQDEPVRFMGVLVDVTERKRAEERLRIAQSAGGVGTFEYMDGFATVSVSDEFCRLLGLHPASVLPVQTVNAVVRPGEPPLFPVNAEGDAGLADDLEGVFAITRADDGAQRWIARRGEKLHEGAGYRLIGVVYDVTTSKQLETALRELNDTLEHRVEQEVANRREAEEALRQAQKMEAVGQLTGGIAHDFNNLLMAIQSSLTLLQKRLPGDPHTDRLIDNAMQGAQRGAALTQRMLAFARRQDLTPVRVEVEALVRGMTDLVQRTIGPAWWLDLDFPAHLPPVTADVNQLEMAVLNLAVNARDAMPDGGVIRIGACAQTVAEGAPSGLAPGRYIGLSVVDAGVGMDEATLSRATEPFFTTKGVGKGTGLGLSMIHGLAKQLGGTFSLESTLGNGTTAILWLPASEEVQAEAAAPAAVERDAASMGSLKILAVDDDWLILMNTGALLEDLGHQVFEAGSGEEALACLRDNPDIDVLITDQAMPGMTGTQLVGHVATLRPDLPIILASGYGEIPADARARIIKLGKPFGQAQLENALAQALQVVSG